jgi:hypothetical protein
MEVVRDGRRIIGFIEQQKDGSWGYAFGRPSQPSFLMFYTDSFEKAKSRILETQKEFKEMLKSAED